MINPVNHARFDKYVKEGTKYQINAPPTPIARLTIAFILNPPE